MKYNSKKTAKPCKTNQRNLENINPTDKFMHESLRTMQKSSVTCKVKMNFMQLRSRKLLHLWHIWLSQSNFLGEVTACHFFNISRERLKTNEFVNTHLRVIADYKIFITFRFRLQLWFQCQYFLGELIESFCRATRDFGKPWFIFLISCRPTFLKSTTYLELFNFDVLLLLTY